MPLAPEATRADLESERKHRDSAATESAVHDTTLHPLGGVFSGLGADGSDATDSRLVSGPLLQRRANGEMRTLVMRRLQQGAGNQKAQQFVAHLRRASVIQRACACGGTCASCQEKQEKGVEEEESKVLQRQASSAGARGGAVDADVIPTDSPGQPLDHSTREFMEPRFGSDFSDVRVHTDSRAAQSANALAADAYTAGRDIYFAAGKYAPTSRDGQHLLAHELTHAVQQANGAMPVAASRTGGVLVGAVSHPLETEAEHTAEVISGNGNVYGSDEKTSTHLASPAVHGFVQRQPVPASPSPSATPAPIPQGPEATAPPQTTPATAPSQAGKAGAQAPPVPQSEIIKTLDGIALVDDGFFMRYQLEQLTIKRDGDAPRAFFELLEADCETDEMAQDRELMRDSEAGEEVPGVPPTRAEFDAYDRMKSKERKVLGLVQTLVGDLEGQRIDFIAGFERQAKVTARNALEQSKNEEKSEALRYGLEWKTIERMMSDCLLGDCKYVETTYSMGEQSPMLVGLQGAAKLLLQRRRELDQAREDQKNAHQGAGEGAGAEVAQAADDAAKQLKEKGDAYNLLRGYLSEKYPILAAFSDPDKGTGDLEDLVTKKAGPDMAALIGQGIVERLTNVEKVNKGLDDSGEVNIWRLPRLVGLTSREMGADVDPLKKTWVDNKVEDEQPGLLESIALLVLNIVALALAAPTGGLSLAVAAGVNAAVAVQHVKDYEMQEALAGTAFDKAHALSQDEPSFFWLAVEIVGVAVDATAAFKAISTAAKAVEATKATEEAARIAEENLRKVATPYVGEEVAQRIVAQLGEEAGTESKALKALGVTEEETDLLEAGSRAAKEELAEGVADASEASGPIKISRAGHIFTCHSPCEYLLEKYRDILGSELKLEGEATTLKEQYLELEKRAVQAAEDVELAKPAEVAKAKEAVTALEKEIEVFDQKLALEVEYSNAVKKLGQLDPDVAAKFLDLNKNAVVRMSALDANALKSFAQLEPGALAKFAELPESTLRNFAKLDAASLKALSEIDPTALGKLENAKDLDVSSKVGSKEPWKGSGKAPQWDNPKGKVYKHVVSEHGADRLKSPARIWDRMRNTHQAQGIWRDNALIVEAEKLAPPFQGSYLIDMGKDIGDVFELDNSISKGVTKFFLRRGPDGELISAYPTSGKFTGW